MRRDDLMDAAATGSARGRWGIACLAIAALSFLCACTTTRPAYDKPAVEVPAAFKEAGLWKQANPDAGQVPDDWWLLFNDPVLNDLEKQVEVNNQNLVGSAAQYRIAQAALASAQSALFPTFGASFGATRSGSGAAGGSRATTYNITGSASWELDLWGRLAGGIDAARARLQATQDDVAAARLSIQSTLAQTYFSLRAAESQADLLQTTLTAYERSLQLTQNRYQAGVASSVDVAQAQTQLKSTEAALIETRSSRAQLEHALAVLVGKAPAQFSLAPSATMPALPPVPVELPSTLLERRPDIAAAERRVAAANSQVGVARAAFFPSLGLSGNAGFRGASLASLVSAPNFFWSVGPSLVLAALDGGARQAGVDSARAALDLAAADYRQTVLQAFQEVEDNLVILANLQEQMVVQGEALTAARKVLEVVNNQYQAGTVGYLNVVSAQATVLSVERSFLDLRTRQLNAANTLLKNIGGRWEAVPAGELAPPSGYRLFGR